VDFSGVRKTVEVVREEEPPRSRQATRLKPGVNETMRLANIGVGLPLGHPVKTGC